MKHKETIELFLHVRMNWENKPVYSVYMTDMSSDELFGALVTKTKINVDFTIPEKFNVNAELVNSLRKHQKAIQADAQMKLTQIEDKIQRLLCIEHTEGL